jgi:hypothetical protein
MANPFDQWKKVGILSLVLEEGKLAAFCKN